MAQATDVRTFREEFPVTQDWSYLNHAAYGPFPQRTVRAVTEWAESFAQAPTFFGPEREKIPAEAAAYVAGLAGTTCRHGRLGAVAGGRHEPDGARRRLEGRRQRPDPGR